MQGSAATTPKRHKPWYRARNIVLALLLAMIAWVVYMIIWATTVQPNPNVNYGLEIEGLSAAAQPQGENGWPWVKNATEIMQAVEDEYGGGSNMNRVEAQQRSIDYFALLSAEATEAETLVASHALEELQKRGAFEQLAEAAQRPNIVRPIAAPDGEPLLMVLLPEIAQLRDLAKARVVMMRMALEAGDAAEAADAFGQTLFIAQVCTRQGLLIYQLVGRSVAAMALQQLRLALMDSQLDASALRQILSTLDRITPLGPVAIALEGERRSILDVIQRTHSDNGRGDGTFLPAEIDELGLLMLSDVNAPNSSPFGGAQELPAIWNVAGIFFASRKEITAKANEFFDQMVHSSRLSPGMRKQNPFNDAEYFMGLDWRYMMIRLLLPALDKAIDVCDGSDCEIAGTKLMLAIELYRAEQGAYPQDLIALVPDILPALPQDPFSTNGFIYKQIPRDEHGREYLLYTVGADGADNNGEPAARASDALSNRGKGFDLVFNQPEVAPH